jgi:hypothetical protein
MLFLASAALAPGQGSIDAFMKYGAATDIYVQCGYRSVDGKPSLQLNVEEAVLVAQSSCASFYSRAVDAQLALLEEDQGRKMAIKRRSQNTKFSQSHMLTLMRNAIISHLTSVKTNAGPNAPNN